MSVYHVCVPHYIHVCVPTACLCIMSVSPTACLCTHCMSVYQCLCAPLHTCLYTPLHVSLMHGFSHHGILKIIVDIYTRCQQCQKDIIFSCEKCNFIQGLRVRNELHDFWISRPTLYRLSYRIRCPPVYIQNSRQNSR